MAATSFLYLLLLQCGDVESNPGPPRRTPAPAPKKQPEPTKEEQASQIGEKVKEYEEKIASLEKTVKAQREDIDNLKNIVKNLEGVDDKLLSMQTKMDAITGVYDDLHEKMHEIDKTRKNNLLMYGIKPDFLPEIPAQLESKIHEIMRFNLHISREIPLTKISRMISGPEVRGCRPVLVNFVHWKDREEVLRKSNFLRGSHIYITEDLSRKVREHRVELQKYARQIRSRSPEKKCTLRQDKLFIDNQMYVYDEDKHEVVRHTRPPSPPRAPSRNYSAVDNGLRRSTSVHSVNGEPDGLMPPRGHLQSSNGGLSPRLQSASSQRFASTESLHLSQHPTSQSVQNENGHQDPPNSLTNGLHEATILEVKEEEQIEEKKEEAKEE